MINKTITNGTAKKTKGLNNCFEFAINNNSSKKQGAKKMARYTDNKTVMHLSSQDVTINKTGTILTVCDKPFKLSKKIRDVAITPDYTNFGKLLLDEFIQPILYNAFKVTLIKRKAHIRTRILNLLNPKMAFRVDYRAEYDPRLKGNKKTKTVKTVKTPITAMTPSAVKIKKIKAKTPRDIIIDKSTTRAKKIRA